MRTLSEYFTEVFGEGIRVRKIGVNASLGCPNRDGTLGREGCIYCNNAAFTPAYAGMKTSISTQLEAGIRFYGRKEKADAYLAYFQSFSNTYGDTAALISLYEEALAYPGVRGLVIATRPDCLGDDLLEYFTSRFATDAAAGKPYLMVELGIESTLDRTLRAINRGHDWACSINAIKRLAGCGIPAGAHLIIGLPGETVEDYRRHIREISALPVTALKLHQLQVVAGTPLADMWRENPEILSIKSPEAYAKILNDILPLLREDIVVDRLVSECPPPLLLAPCWGLKPSQFALNTTKSPTSNQK